MPKSSLNPVNLLSRCGDVAGPIRSKESNGKGSGRGKLSLYSSGGRLIVGAHKMMHTSKVGKRMNSSKVDVEDEEMKEEEA